MAADIEKIEDLQGRAKEVYDRLYENLPYDWLRPWHAPEGTTPNVAKVLAVFAVFLSQIYEVIDQFPETRDLDDADDHALDLLGQTYGVHRMLYQKPDVEGGTLEVREPDGSYRDRIKWHIFIQESWGNRAQVREITAWWLRIFKRETGLGGVVPKSWLTVDIWNPGTHEPRPGWEMPRSFDPDDVRDVEAKDLYVYNNLDPVTGLESPDDDHPYYGGMNAFFVIQIPWPAVPLAPNQNALIWRDDGTFDTLDDPPADDKHGWSYGVWNAIKQVLLLEELLEAMKISRAAGVEARPYGYGGCIMRDQADFDDPTDPPTDQHGWNEGPWDGDLRQTLHGMNTFNPIFWEVPDAQ